MLRLLGARSPLPSAPSARALHRFFCDSATPTPPAATSPADPSKSSVPAYRTQPEPTYTLPYYGASDDELAALPAPTVRQAIKAYGGLLRKHDAEEALRERLRRLTNADLHPAQLTIEGVVVSNKMQKSVVVAARRHAYSQKLRMPYLKTRRFKAHDEFDLCREGDRVVIRSCRPLSREKAHVVVQNFGDKSRVEEDTRRIVLGETGA